MARTHFERIPVETVQKIVEELNTKKKTQKEPSKRWRVPPAEMISRFEGVQKSVWFRTDNRPVSSIALKNRNGGASLWLL